MQGFKGVFSLVADGGRGNRNNEIEWYKSQEQLATTVVLIVDTESK